MFIDETRELGGGNPGRLENRPDFVLVFLDFGGSTRYRSKSVEGRPVLSGFRQLTELEPRLAGWLYCSVELVYRSLSGSWNYCIANGTLPKVRVREVRR